MSVKITGQKQLNAAFDAFEPKLRKKIGRKAVRKAAKPVAETQRARIANDEGDARKSIVVRALKRSRRNKHKVGVRVIAGHKLSNRGYNYIGAIEYGTSDTKAQPFARPSMDENRKTVLTVFDSEIGKLIEETAREVRR